MEQKLGIASSGSLQNVLFWPSVLSKEIMISFNCVFYAIICIFPRPGLAKRRIGNDKTSSSYLGMVRDLLMYRPSRNSLESSWRINTYPLDQSRKSQVKLPWPKDGQLPLYRRSLLWDNLAVAIAIPPVPAAISKIFNSFYRQIILHQLRSRVDWPSEQ